MAGLFCFHTILAIYITEKRWFPSTISFLFHPILRNIFPAVNGFISAPRVSLQAGRRTSGSLPAYPFGPSRTGINQYFLLFFNSSYSWQ